MKFSLNITGVDKNDTAHTLPSPFYFILQRDVDAPADALTLVFLNQKIPEISFVEITGDVDFYGVVDTVCTTKDKSGEKTTLYCRSIAAMLLDTQETPGKTLTPNINVVAISCSCGGRLKGFLYDSYTPIPSLNVSGGASKWSFLTNFCEQTMGNSPRITKDRYISTKPFDTHIVHKIDDYLYSKEETDYSEVITSVSVRGEEGNYPISMQNPYVSLPISRHRYVTPGVGWQNFREEYGKRVMRKSMLRFKTKTVTVSGFRPFEIGNSALVDGEEKVIIAVEFHLEESGAFTKITLSEKEYL